MELAIRFDPETEQFQLVSDGNVLGGVDKSEWSPWVENVEGIGVQPVVEETSSEEVVDAGGTDEVDSSTEGTESTE